MTDGFTVCIYQNAEVCKESNGVAFPSNNFPIMTSLSRAIDFKGLMQVVHQTLRLQPYQQVSHLIYRMPYVSDDEFLGTQPAASDEEYGAYEDHLMGNNIEDEDYEEEDPNDYEREDPYQYEEVDMGHVGSSSGTEFRPTPHQSQINLSGLRGLPYDGDITGIGTWTEYEDLRSGLVFADKDGVQDALKLFSLKRHVDYRVTRSAEKFIECKCVHHAKGCKWRVRASYRVDLQLWMISRYDGPHSCASTVIAKDHPKLHSDMIAGVIAGLVIEKEDIPISLVVETVKKARGFTISYKKAWRGKQNAIARVYGSWVASYIKLPAYATSGRDVPVRQVQALAADRDGAGHKQEYCPRRVCTCRGGDRICVDVVFVEAPRARREGSRDNPGTGWQPPLGHNVFCIRHVASNLNSKFRNRVIRALLMKACHEYTEREFFNNRRQQVQAQINVGHVLCEELRDTIFTNLEIVRICKVSLRNQDLACANVTHEFGLYVDPVYKLETMLVAYSQPFHPVEGEEYWPHVSGRPVMPNPQVLRPPGRPRSTRIRNEMD
ncbi:Serine/threonine-protein phosphatase 7 long form-like [Senna tora]|uniref:Serine/threonine-protein phosphatase 7 long form-like n=1 Tax=Senna tora TaxID=362788 RepID=A0A834XBM0_9FABA|nr:Serine/threonine-protein phosphatase 7 long form-like [Senna tora]